MQITANDLKTGKSSLVKIYVEGVEVGEVRSIEFDSFRPSGVRRTDEFQLKVVEISVRLTIGELRHCLQRQKSVLTTRQQQP